MKLQIRVTGMCLIVPQTVGDKLLYHILLPDSSHHQKHDAIITYRGAGKPYDLGCHYLDLSGIKATPGTATLDNVVDVGGLVDDRVEAKQVGKTPGKDVHARVTIPAPTRTEPGDRAEWEPQKPNGTAMEKMQSTHHMTWIYEDFDMESLDLTLVRLDNGCTGNPTPTLPCPEADANDVVCINITHLPPPGDVVNQGEFAPHFHMYGHLFSPQKAPKMKLLKKPAGFASKFFCDGAPEPLVPPLAETAFNCMLARAVIK